MIRGRKVLVNDGNTEKALRKFKKLITEYGTLQEVRAKSQAKRRWQKYLRDQSLPKKLF